jgi:hypothetical protein
MDDIRPPDKSINEQLIEDTRSDFEKEIDEALYISMLEVKKQQDINSEYEEKIISEYIKETNRRKEIFKDFLFNVNKIGKFDKEIKEIYDIIEPIIDSYCGQIFESCELDEETYNKIFNTLKNIRNNQNALDILRSILQY